MGTVVSSWLLQPSYHSETDGRDVCYIFFLQVPNLSRCFPRTAVSTYVISHPSVPQFSETQSNIIVFLCFPDFSQILPRRYRGETSRYFFTTRTELLGEPSVFLCRRSWCSDISRCRRISGGPCSFFFIFVFQPPSRALTEM